MQEKMFGWTCIKIKLELSRSDNINIKEQWIEYVNNMTWSFSRLNGFGTGCKYCWFENYANKRKDSTNNAFAEYGLMMHEILEGLDKKELMLWDLLPLFEAELDRKSTRLNSSHL